MAVFPTAPEQQPSSSTIPRAPVLLPAQSAPQGPVTIPLDQPEPVVKAVNTEDGAEAGADAPSTALRRTPLRRDSMKRREALLKGKEGSRRRQRWENDNFLNNPSFAPPTAEDFSPTALHPRRVVRYEFATLWDPSNPAKYGYATAHHVPSSAAKGAGSHDEKRVPKNLKDRLKRSKGAMDLLKSLEEEVRRYAATLWGCVDEYCHGSNECAVEDDEDEEDKDCDKMDTSVDFGAAKKSIVEEEMKDSEDEEIVFVPRMKTIKLDSSVEAAQQVKEPVVQREVYIPVLGPPLEKSVFEAPHDDQGASFGRWLVHSIALYYGLRSWSETQGSPAKRIAFVGAQPNERKRLKSGRLLKHPKALPRPLWMML
ncbi:hypothetical protein TWF102_008558 [Orbilia oligospora]|uniref:R3H-associated N-terminal domain-containing protein n=1 Tax=Orbilia oligospora TaxID=2813651 RepID=A0A7C8J698_ORBOL|nr:hypothetical protein TWF102_008558 [Orbilia oligospora]KAF3118237.1 hypothetical protein TWF103_000255 [Orbilia oligospora]